MYRHFRICYDVPGEGGPGGASGTLAPAGPGAAPPGAAPAGPSAPPPGSAAPSGTPPPSSAGAPPAAPPRRFEYAEDRNDWIPPHRLSEVARRAQEFRSDADRYRAMLEAGTGVRMREEQRVSPEVQEAREAFAQVFGPDVARLLTPEHVGPLLQFLEALKTGNVNPQSFSTYGNVVQGTEHQWAQHGRQFLDTIYTDVARDYGTETLTPRQQRAIGNEFVEWLREDTTGARETRYTRGDRTLSGEFLTEYRAGFIDPFRRGADAAVITRGARNAQLPAPPRNGGAPPPPPAAPLTEEQVHDNAWNSFQAMQGRR